MLTALYIVVLISVHRVRSWVKDCEAMSLIPTLCIALSLEENILKRIIKNYKESGAERWWRGRTV